MTLPGPLVGTAWLADHLDDPSVRIVDSTYFMPDAGRDAQAEYAAAHIPGAVFFDIDAVADPSNPLPHMLPSPELFAEQVGAIGIGSEHLEPYGHYKAKISLDAIRDGWRIIEFPNLALLLDESRTYAYGAEFVLEKIRSA